MAKRKEHLQSLRDLRQPLNHEELLEHSKRVEEMQKLHVTLKLEKMKSKSMAELEKTQALGKYKTKFLDKILEQDTI